MRKVGMEMGGKSDRDRGNRKGQREGVEESVRRQKMDEANFAAKLPTKLNSCILRPNQFPDRAFSLTVYSIDWHPLKAWRIKCESADLDQDSVNLDTKHRR